MHVIPDDFDFEQYLSVSTPTEKVIPASGFTSDVMEMLFNPGGRPRKLLPWEKLHGKFDLRPGEVTIWGGSNGGGKSLITTQIAGDLMLQGAKVGIASMEMLPASTAMRMLVGMAGTRSPTREYAEFFMREWTQDRLWLLDVQHSVRGSRIVDAIRYCWEKHGVSHFFVDSLMKCVKNEDDYNGQKDFVEQLCRTAMDLKQVHIHLVAHTKKSDSDYDVPDKGDIRGATVIADQVDNIVLVWRNRRKEDALADPKLDAKKRAELIEMPDTVLLIKKQRHHDWEGKAGLFLHRESLSFVNSYSSRHPMPDIGFKAPQREPEEVPF